MMLTAETVYGWFRELIERRRRLYSSDRVHVSEVAGCLRRAYYERTRPRPALDPSNVVMLIGNGVHEKLQELLASRGWLAEVEARYRIKDFWLVGHADLYHPDEQLVVELKTTNKAPEEPYRSHLIQLNAYLYMLRARRGYIVYIARNGEVKVYKHRFDKSLWRQTIQRAIALRESITRKKKPPKEPGPWCTYCPYRWLCYTKR